MMSWDQYFMSFARLTASKSKDPTTQVGCILVDLDRNVIASGFNGLPRGVTDEPARMERPVKYLWTTHAEANAVAAAARRGAAVRAATAYVTHRPCAQCAALLVQAGVSRIVCDGGTTSMPTENFAVSDTILAEAGVHVQQTEDLT